MIAHTVLDSKAIFDFINKKTLQKTFVEKIDLQIKNDAKQTPIEYAATLQQWKDVEILLTHLPKEITDSNLYGIASAFECAVRHNQTELALKLLALDKHLNQWHDKIDGYQAIHSATQNANKTVVSKLIEYNIDPNQPTISKEPTTPLHIAASEEKIELLAYLIEAKANPQAFDHRKLTPLETAAKNKKWQSVDALLNLKIPYSPDMLGYTLVLAVHHRAPQHIHQKLIELGANQHYQTVTSDSEYFPIHQVVKNGDFDLFKIILKAKASLAITTKNEKLTVLQVAEKYKQEKIVELIKSHYKNEEQLLEKSYQAIFPAILEDKVSTFPLAHIDLTILNEKKESPILYALKKEKLKSAQYLLDLIPQLNKKPADIQLNLSVPHATLFAPDLNIVQSLVSAKADINNSYFGKTMECNGYYAIHVAIHKKELQLTKFLLEKKADPSLASKAMSEAAPSVRPLDLAVAKDVPDIISALLTAKADPEKRNAGGRTPLEEAFALKQWECVKRFLQHPDHKTKPEILSKILYQAFHEHPEDLEKILEAKANPNATHEKETGFNILHKATLNKNISVIQLLLKHKASPYVDIEWSSKVEKVSNTLEFATALDQPEILTLFLNDDKWDKHTNSDKLTLFEFAAVKKKWRSLYTLLNQAKTIDKHVLGRILNIAMENDQHELAKLIIAKGAKLDIESKNESGYFPIHYAIQAKDIVLVQKLLDAKADPDQLTSITNKNKKSTSALELAKKLGEVEIAELLDTKKIKAPVFFKDNFTDVNTFTEMCKKIDIILQLDTPTPMLTDIQSLFVDKNLKAKYTLAAILKINKKAQLTNNLLSILEKTSDDSIDYVYRALLTLMRYQEVEKPTLKNKDTTIYELLKHKIFDPEEKIDAMHPLYPMRSITQKYTIEAHHLLSKELSEKEFQFLKDRILQLAASYYVRDLIEHGTNDASTIKNAVKQIFGKSPLRRGPIISSGLSNAIDKFSKAVKPPKISHRKSLGAINMVEYAPSPKLHDIHELQRTVSQPLLLPEKKSLAEEVQALPQSKNFKTRIESFFHRKSNIKDDENGKTSPVKSEAIVMSS